MYKIGEARKIQDRKKSTIQSDCIPHHKFYVDSAKDEGVVFSQVLSIVYS